MFKKIGLSVAALAAGLLFAAPQKADAKVHIGVYLGAPAYTYPAPPAYPIYPDPYVYSYSPYNYGYGYAAPVYGYPSYAAPYYTYRGGREWREHERHVRIEHRRIR